MSNPKPDIHNPFQRTGGIHAVLAALSFHFLLDETRMYFPTPIAYGVATTLYCLMMSAYVRKQAPFVWWRWGMMSALAGFAMTLFCLAVNAWFGVLWVIKAFS